MAVWPFIISRKTRKQLGEQVIRHEKIHFRQQLEMGFLFFFIWYFIEYFIRLIQSGDKQSAYRNMVFEREAYDFEKFENYLKERKPFSWFQYYKNGAEN